MKKTSKTVIFFGNERLATGVTTSAPTLRVLLSGGYNVAAVASNYTPGHSRSKRKLEIEEVAEEAGVPVFTPGKLSDIKQQLTDYAPEVGVLVAYGKIVPQSIIDIFPRGIVNIHPSLLPRHRGPTPIESVILSGETETGVSLMHLSKEMDAGPLFSQRKITLSGNEGKQELAEKLLNLGSRMLIELLPDVIKNIKPKAQDSNLATYDQLISKNDGIMDFNKPALQLEHEIRAFAGWPKSRAKLANKDVIITKAHVLPLAGRVGDVKVIDNNIVVFCTKDALAIERLQPSGKTEMRASDFVRGYMRQ